MLNVRFRTNVRTTLLFGWILTGKSRTKQSNHTFSILTGELETMIFVEWKSEYDIGHAEIDQQHQELFRLANQIFQSLGSDKNNMMWDPFEDLFGYTKKHFSDEEVVWLRNVPDLVESHLSKHTALTDRLENIWRNSTIYNTEETADKLYDWVQTLLFHVLNFDQKMNRELQERS